MTQKEEAEKKQQQEATLSENLAEEAIKNRKHGFKNILEVDAPFTCVCGITCDSVISLTEHVWHEFGKRDARAELLSSLKEKVHSELEAYLDELKYQVDWYEGTSNGKGRAAAYKDAAKKFHNHSLQVLAMLNEEEAKS